MKWLDKQEITLGGWLVGSAGILIIRFFFEALSSHAATGIIATDLSTLVHYALFYFGVAVSLLLILAFLDPKNKTRHPKLVLFGLPIIWLPPLVDLVLLGGMDMAYIFATPSELFTAWATFLGPLQEPGITLGIRLEIFLVMIGTTIYLWQSQKKILKALFGALLAYTAIFLWVSFPSVLGWITGFDPLVLFFDLPAQSIPLQNIFHPTMQSIGSGRAQELLFNVSISHLAAFTVFPLFLLYSWTCFRDTVRAIWRNKRGFRVIHYLIIGLVGILIGYQTNGIEISNFYDISGVIFFALAIVFAWLFAVGVNDITDQKIDAVSNKERPLITGKISIENMKEINKLFFLLLVLCGYLAGHHALFAILMFTGAYYIYSAPPLRLKRIPIIQSLLIAFATIAVFTGGFFMLTESHLIDLVPLPIVLTLLLVFTLVANLKDLKDLEGDKKAGISTLPVMLGMERAQQLIGIFLAISFVLIGWVFNLSLGLSLIFAILSFIAVQRTPFDERRVFLLYFAYTAIATLLYLT